MQIQAAINQLVKEGKAPSTVRKAQTLLHCALEQSIMYFFKKWSFHLHRLHSCITLTLTLQKPPQNEKKTSHC